MPEYDPVGTVAFFRERHRVEATTTARVLMAFPPDKLSYAPHRNSSTAGFTAWTIVRCFQLCQDLLEASTAAVSCEGHPDHKTLLSEFQSVSHAIAESLRKLEQQDWIIERIVMAEETIILRQPLE